MRKATPCRVPGPMRGWGSRRRNRRARAALAIPAVPAPSPRARRRSSLDRPPRPIVLPRLPRSRNRVRTSMAGPQPPAVAGRRPKSSIDCARSKSAPPRTLFSNRSRANTCPRARGADVLEDRKMLARSTWRYRRWRTGDMGCARDRLSNYHLAARDIGRGGFAEVGKTFKGLTDAQFEAITERLLAIGN